MSHGKGIHSTVRVLMIGAILAALSAVSCFSLGLSASTSASPGGISVSISTRQPPVDQVLKTLNNGMRAEVSFVIQVYQKSNGLFRLFGDRLVQEVRVTRDARWDPYGKQYVISGTDRPEVDIRTATGFRHAFFDLDDFELPWSFIDGRHPPAQSAASYLMVRVQVRPMKLVPALAILSFLRIERELSSGWSRVELPEAGRTARGSRTAVK